MMEENRFAKYVEGNRFAQYAQPEQTAYEKTAQKANALDNLAAAVGGAAYGTYLGGKQRLMQALDVINPQEQSRAAAMAPDIEENRAAMEGLRSTKSGVAGDIIGNMMTTAPLMLNPVAGTIKGATAIGAGLGALAPTVGDESVAQNALKGAALGAGGAWLGNKIAGALVGKRGQQATGGNATASSTGGASEASSTVSGGANVTGSGGGYNFGSVGEDTSAGLSRMQKQLIERNPDFKLTPGQASGSKSLQQLEAKLESQPMTSGQFNKIKADNQTLINQRVAESIGVKANTVDADVLNQAHDKVSRVYELVKKTPDRTINPDDFLGGLSNIEKNYEGLLFTGGKPFSVMDHPLTARLMQYAQNGQATAEQLTDLSSKLGKAARNQMTGASGDRQLGMALNEVKDLSDDLISQGLTGRTQKLFDQARGNYRNLMTIESRVGIVNPSTGNVNGSTLANALQQKDKAGYLLGRNTSPMYEAARLSQAFKPIVGDSGTATRSALPSPTDFVLSLPFNVVTKAYASAPAVNLAAKGGAISRNGLLQSLDPNMVKYLPQAGAMGLLSLPQ